MKFVVLMLMLATQCWSGEKLTPMNRRWAYDDYKQMEEYHGLSKLDVGARVIKVPKSKTIAGVIPDWYVKACSFTGNADSLPFNFIFVGDWQIDIKGIVLEQVTVNLNGTDYKVKANSIDTSDTVINGRVGANQNFVIQYRKGVLKVWTKIRDKLLLEQEVGAENCTITLKPNMQGLATGRYLFAWTRINVKAKVLPLPKPQPKVSSAK